MRRVVLMSVLLLLGCGGARVEGPAPWAARGLWGAGGEGPVRYLDWYFGVGYSLKDWSDVGIDERQWFMTYEATLTYHVSYSWDVEYAMWAGRFNTPHTTYMLQSFAHTLALRYTRPAGLGWWYLSVGPSWCENDNTDAYDALGFRVATGYAYPIFRPLSLAASVGYINNETELTEVGGGGSISLSVLSVAASLAVTF